MRGFEHCQLAQAPSHAVTDGTGGPEKARGVPTDLDPWLDGVHYVHDAGLLAWQNQFDRHIGDKVANVREPSAFLPIDCESAVRERRTGAEFDGADGEALQSQVQVTSHVVKIQISLCRHGNDLRVEV